MLSIHTNLSSLIAQSSLNQSTNKLNQAIERMSTGYKINHAGDNAANYSIVNDMSAKIGSYEVAEDNVSMGLDLISTANSSLDLIASHLNRIRDLCEQASNGTYGADSISAIKQEAQARVDEIYRLYANTEYNGMKLLDKIELPEAAQSMIGYLTPQYNGFIEDATYYYTDEELAAMTSVADVTGDYTNLGRYKISTAEELIKFSEDAAAGKNINGGMRFVLANDIDMSAYTNFNPIAADGCLFFGNGHVIKNLTINAPDTDYVGLFKKSHGSAELFIFDLGLEDCNITGRDYVGGLMGYGDYVQNCYVTGSIAGHDYVGGICGQNAGMDNYFIGSVIGNDYVGGISGKDAGSYCFAIGMVTGNNNVGGITGEGASWTPCYTKTIVTGNNNVGGLVGHITDPLSGGYSLDDVNPNSLITTMQVGINSDSNSQIEVNTSIGLFGLNAFVAGISSSSTLTVIDNVIKQVTNKQTELGAAQNRLESALESIGVNYNNLVSSRSTLRDADIAEVSSKYIQQQILQQASSTLLATANQSPAIALQLI